MLFNSVEYLVFLPVVLGIYYVLRLRAQNVWLLAASWFFYGWWDYRFLSLIAISTVVDYVCGRAIPQASSKKKRRSLVLISVVTNLSILGFFKYFNFFVDSAVDTAHLIGLELTPIVLQILLPMGISFYTFQTMAYTIDIYRDKQKPCDSFVNFALYVSFFPQLVAGPIERASRLLPQIESRRTVDTDKISDGMVLLTLGFFKKIAVADVVAPIVNQIFSEPGQYEAATLILGVYLFAIQIYCDFSGYTDIARGSSKLLGIDLIENFNHPYFATSITDFWRRWHMSLSSWLRDYLYIPLGGNRKGKLKTYRNIMITMLLGGLWHGASWNFVIWGALHGVFLGIHRYAKNISLGVMIKDRLLSIWTVLGKKHWTKTKADHDSEVFSSRLWATVFSIFTFHLVCFAWIFFRADDFSTAYQYIRGICEFSFSSDLGIDPWMLLRTVLPLALLGVVEILQSRYPSDPTFKSSSAILQRTMYFGFFVCLIIFGAFYEEVPFIYFQF